MGAGAISSVHVQAGQRSTSSLKRDESARFEVRGGRGRRKRSSPEVSQCPGAVSMTMDSGLDAVDGKGEVASRKLWQRNGLRVGSNWEHCGTADAL